MCLCYLAKLEKRSQHFDRFRRHFRDLSCVLDNISKKKDLIGQLKRESWKTKSNCQCKQGDKFGPKVLQLSIMSLCVGRWVGYPTRPYRNSVTYFFGILDPHPDLVQHFIIPRELAHVLAYCLITE